MHSNALPVYEGMLPNVPMLLCLVTPFLYLQLYLTLRGLPDMTQADTRSFVQHMNTN